ncbi:hypothetical protein GW17_00051545 [Ensete ventricosum]|nr:hypothetical protein GW17_00051545 [Ensete ventricosum]
MLPLRFPNCGIRAKVFEQKIGFKLRAMRLNRVEIFYAFLLRFYSEAARKGVAGHNQSPLQGKPARKGQLPAGVATPIGGDRLRSGRKCRLPAARLQGAAPRLRLPLVRVATGRSGRRHSCKAARPAREVLPESSGACRKGGYPLYQHAVLSPARGDGGDAEGQESLGHSF